MEASEHKYRESNGNCSCTSTSEVPTAVPLNIQVFWGVALCNYFLMLQTTAVPSSSGLSNPRRKVLFTA